MSLKAVANLLMVTFPKMSSYRSGASSAHTSADQTVTHDRTKQQFSVRLGDSREEAVLQYRYIGTKMIDLHSTSVPVTFRGKGVGGLLAQAALNFVVEEDLKMRISCWFVRKYVDDNPQPQYRERIVD
ncbi:protein NATD1-like [Scyliorhinus torazame]